ncbi:MAG: thioesterase-like protein [Rhodospirillaceae bacterium]|jgi:acyl-CoA thioester hydrolase|nr:thioesterase-like protein [Rhodospirillaceae bacterium]MBT4488061.1 thioesterase-like protein [Rhodospirillaceae bacterium]MBT5191266.1 thioesterase-like protein [Rhodospirillaceae bacterium]MBT5894749.1 thioesterase-like protein [Rhodospirillaceae bacterium]MBT6426325.1 thioesterase-like protein [Rhodospirillaceae bacterium]
MSIPTPLDQFNAIVKPEWIDHNGHMNMGYYMVVFDFATDEFMDFVHLTRAHRKEFQVTTFSLEGHITYNREIGEGDPMRFTTQLLDFDAKRFHYIHHMYHGTEGYLAATNELMSLHVSETTRRSAPMEPVIMERLAAIKEAHATLPPNPYTGRLIGLRSKATTNT